MLLGEKIKEAIQSSEFKIEDVAAHIGISHHNLYRMYRKDSFEIKYLIKIAEKLELPLGYFLNDETISAVLNSNSGQANYANKVGKNNQSITVGDSESQKKLEDCEKERDLLRKAVADKEMIIELLRGQK